MRKKQQRIGKISIFVEDRFRLSKTQAKAQQICQAFVSTQNNKKLQTNNLQTTKRQTKTTQQ